MHLNGDNHIQNFYLGRYIVAVKLNFRPYMRRYTSPNENFEYSYPLNEFNLIRANVIGVSG